MVYQQTKLPYAYDALEPYLSEENMMLHYSKHHKAYYDKLNDILKGYKKYQKYSPSILVQNWRKLPSAIQQDVRNQGGGVVNHDLFWTILTPNSSKNPSGEIASQIKEDFGSFDKFKQKYIDTAKKLFGSGWTWLIYNNKKLKIINLPNQDSPLTDGNYPIIGLDLFEHAYYPTYLNEKDKYLDAIWNIWNWPEINKRFIKARKIYENQKPKTSIQDQYSR